MCSRLQVHSLERRIKNMAYRSNPQYYRSWNALALGLKTEGPEEPNKIDGLLSKDRQRPRRESWSQPPQRGRGPLRGRGTWYIDNRQNNRPQNRRRYTMPDSQDYSYHSNDEPSDYNQLEDNPIIEEPRNLSVSPESDYSDIKTKENDEEKSDYQDETSSWDRKQNYPTDNIYRPPRSRSASWNWKSNSSSDDGSQSRYSSGSSKKYEPENYKAQRKNSWEREPEPEPDQAWVHDKFEYIDSDFDQKDQKDQKYKKERKDASTQVTPIDINNELKKHNIKETACEFSKKINKPESPKDKVNLSAIAELPKEITIKFSELMKESNDEKPESIIPQTSDSKNEELSIEPEVVSEEKFEEVLPEVTSEAIPGVIIPPEVAPEVPKVIPEVTPKVTPETTSEVTPETTSEVTPEITSEKEELQIQILINLDEDDDTGIQPIQPKISEDIYALDWGSYQKTLMEEEIRLTMERPVKMSTPHKLNTELKDFDSLL